MPVKPFARSSWMARNVARNLSRTGSAATPGFSCTSVRSQKLLELARVRGFFIIIGMKTSVTVPVSVPVKPLFRDADNLVQVVTHAEGPPDHFRICAKRRVQ